MFISSEQACYCDTPVTAYLMDSNYGFQVRKSIT